MKLQPKWIRLISNGLLALMLSLTVGGPILNGARLLENPTSTQTVQVALAQNKDEASGDQGSTGQGNQQATEEKTGNGDKTPVEWTTVGPREWSFLQRLVFYGPVIGWAPGFFAALWDYKDQIFTKFFNSLAHIFAWVNGNVASFLEDTIIDGSEELIKSDLLFRIWSGLLTMANSLFLLALIIAAIAIILRLDVGTYNFKKFLGALIGGIILANLSYSIAILIIDLAGVTALGALNLAPRVTGEAKVLLGGTGGFWHRLTTLFSGGPGIKGSDLGVAFLHAMIQGVGVIVLFRLLLLFVQRGITLVLLIAVSPLVFPLGLLPNMRQWTSKWWSELMKWSFVLPVVYFLFGLAWVFFLAFQERGLEAQAAGGGTGLSGISSLFLAITSIIIVWLAADTPKFVGVAVAGTVNAVNKWVGGQMKGAGRAVGIRAAGLGMKALGAADTGIERGVRALGKSMEGEGKGIIGGLGRRLRTTSFRPFERVAGMGKAEQLMQKGVKRQWEEMQAKGAKANLTSLGSRVMADVTGTEKALDIATREAMADDVKNILETKTLDDIALGIAANEGVEKRKFIEAFRAVTRGSRPQGEKGRTEALEMLRENPALRQQLNLTPGEIEEVTAQASHRSNLLSSMAYLEKLRALKEVSPELKESFRGGFAMAAFLEGGKQKDFENIVNNLGQKGREKLSTNLTYNLDPRQTSEVFRGSLQKAEKEHKSDEWDRLRKLAIEIAKGKVPTPQHTEFKDDLGREFGITKNEDVVEFITAAVTEEAQAQDKLTELAIENRTRVELFGDINIRDEKKLGDISALQAFYRINTEGFRENLRKTLEGGSKEFSSLSEKEQSKLLSHLIYNGKLDAENPPISFRTASGLRLKETLLHRADIVNAVRVANEQTEEVANKLVPKLAEETGVITGEGDPNKEKVLLTIKRSWDPRLLKRDLRDSAKATSKDITDRIDGAPPTEKLKLQDEARAIDQMVRNAQDNYKANLTDSFQIGQIISVKEFETAFPIPKREGAINEIRKLLENAYSGDIDIMRDAAKNIRRNRNYISTLGIDSTVDDNQVIARLEGLLARLQQERLQSKIESETTTSPGGGVSGASAPGGGTPPPTGTPMPPAGP